MNYIKILCNDDAQKYSFKCPYCGAEHSLPHNVSCKHVVFGYESINQQPLDMSTRLYGAIERKLQNHHSRGPELFQDAWYEYKPEYESRAEYDPDEYDSARQECIEDYLENRISMDDVIWFLDRLPEFKGYNKHTTLAVYDDVEGDPISYLMFDDEFLAK